MSMQQIPDTGRYPGYVLCQLQSEAAERRL
jgi:hypothetical protein